MDPSRLPARSRKGKGGDHCAGGVPSSESIIMGLLLDAPASKGESGSGKVEHINSSTRSSMSSVQEEMRLPPNTACSE
jgi:hypothetical protein